MADNPSSKTAGGRGSALARATHDLVRSSRHGVLSTLMTDGGYPYGSLVELLPLKEGDVVMLLSSLAEHQRHLAADARASLLIAPHADEADALAKPRVTLVGRVIRVSDGDRPAIEDAYFKLHPTARGYLALGDFQFYRLHVERARYIAGFGGMGWVNEATYRAAASEE